MKYSKGKGLRKEKREKDLSKKKSRSKSNLPERLSYKAKEWNGAYGHYLEVTALPIHLLFIPIIIHKWKTIKIDYILVFSQGPIEEEVFVKASKGF